MYTIARADAGAAGQSVSFTSAPRARASGLLSSCWIDEQPETTTRRDPIEPRRHRALSSLRGARVACAAGIVAVGAGFSATKLLFLLPLAYCSARLRQNILHLENLLVARVHRRWCFHLEWLHSKLLMVCKPLL